MIQRFYDTDNGRILIDGKDIKTLNVAWLRSYIGIVSQEPVLFTGSIEDNIRLGKEDATDEEIISAAKIANAHSFIMKFPDVCRHQSLKISLHLYNIFRTILFLLLSSTEYYRYGI